jgi:hypothetical protein
MALVTLVHPEETFTIPALQAMTKCNIFQNNTTLLISPYRVKSSVSLSIFREFLSAFDGNSINITSTNFTELQRLCNEFGFTEIAAKLSEFRSSTAFKESEDSDARERIAALEEKSNQHSHVIAILQSELKVLSTDFGRLVGEVSALRSAAAGLPTLSNDISRSENANCCNLTHFRTISESVASFSTAAVRCVVRFADHFGLSGDIRRVPKEPNFASVAGQSRWFQSKRISPPM